MNGTSTNAGKLSDRDKVCVCVFVSKRTLAYIGNCQAENHHRSFFQRFACVQQHS